jgi:hypothetical protein
VYSSLVRAVKCGGYLAMALVVLGVLSLTVNADNKKGSSSSAPAKPAAAAPSHASAPSGGGATHASGAGGASHGPTTSGASHGATTSTTTHGPTTSNPGGSTASHSPTTSNPSGGRTTTTSTAGRSSTGSNAAGSRTGTTTGGRTGTTTGTAAGGRTSSTTSAAGGRSTTASRPVPRGTTEHTTASGNTVRTRSNGTRSDVHVANRNMDIHHGLNGNRTVSRERPDGSRVVATRGGPGYVERGYNYHGNAYDRRTYYYGGRYYNNYYRGYYYGGYYTNVYAPGYYYGPAYYGWAYNPWPAPIAYSWGWGGYPWYGYYGGYFAPYPVYPSAAYWLTDYVVSASLAAAYQEAVDAQVEAAKVPPGGSPALDQQTKDMIAEEVKRQIALENQEAQANAQKQDIDPASSGIARMLSDNQTHVFIAGADLDLVEASGQECMISQGDVLEVASAPPSGANAATAVVLCSKGGKECVKSAQVSVPFTDLQEMQNHMRQTIDQGLGDLQSKQGQNGLPAVPPSAKAPPVKSDFAAAAPPPEQNVAADIKQESQQADQAEQEVAKESPPPNPATGGSDVATHSSAPVTVSQGQTVEQVVSALGQPKSVVKLPSKEIYVYQDMKVTFKGGKVSDVQ